MPVYQLKDEMPYDEFLGWLEYFKQRPIGWREDTRIYTVLQTQGVKAKPHEIFESLAIMHQARETRRAGLGENQVESSNLKKSNFFSHMLSAIGGEKIFKEE